jgi:hypothetical protein
MIEPPDDLNVPNVYAGVVIPPHTWPYKSNLLSKTAVPATVK